MTAIAIGSKPYKLSEPINLAEELKTTLSNQDFKIIETIIDAAFIPVTFLKTSEKIGRKSELTKEELSCFRNQVYLMYSCLDLRKIHLEPLTEALKNECNLNKFSETTLKSLEDKPFDEIQKFLDAIYSFNIAYFHFAALHLLKELKTEHKKELKIYLTEKDPKSLELYRINKLIIKLFPKKNSSKAER